MHYNSLCCFRIDDYNSIFCFVYTLFHSLFFFSFKILSVCSCPLFFFLCQFFLFLLLDEKRSLLCTTILCAVSALLIVILYFVATVYTLLSYFLPLFQTTSCFLLSSGFYSFLIFGLKRAGFSYALQFFVLF